jgi:hypothetical protein
MLELSKDMRLFRQSVFGGIDIFNYNEEEIKEVLIKGKVKIVQEKSSYVLDWGVEGNPKGKFYESEILEDPKLADLVKAALEQATCNNNLHHTFLENFEIDKKEGDITYIHLVMGS